MPATLCVKKTLSEARSTSICLVTIYEGMSFIGRIDEAKATEVDERNGNGEKYF